MHKNNGEYGQYIFVPFMIGGKLKGIVEVSSNKGTDMGTSDDELKEIAVRMISPNVQQISRMYTLVEIKSMFMHRDVKALLREISEVRSALGIAPS